MKLVQILFILLISTSCGILSSPSTFFAKEMCSCLFIENQSEKYCAEYLDISLPVWGYEIFKEEKAVYAQGYFHSQKYQLKKPQLGCQLVRK